MGKKDFRLALSLWAVLGMAAVFMAARAAVFFLNREYFGALSGAEIISAFANGLRFDFSVLALFMGPVIFLLNLPVRARAWVEGWAAVLLAEGIFMTGFLIGDLIYFPKVNRHIAEEILQLSNDWGFILSYMLTQTWLPLAVLLAGFGAGVWALCRYTNRVYAPRQWRIKKTAALLLFLLVLILGGIRGHLGRGKTLGVADVYNYASSPAAAAVTLNGVFTAYQVGRKGRMDVANQYPAEQAIKNAQQYLLAADETVPEDAYPLMRRAKAEQAAPAKGYNVVIVLLEGWHPYYVDGLSHHGFGATPVFDEIIKNGVNFSNAYAAGQRSIFGFAAVLAGVPLVPGLPMFGYGLELTAFSPMPKHFAQAGYYTFFAQTSHRDSYRMCALASYLGAQESYGWEDMPERLSYKDRAPFGYDYDAFMFVADKIKNRKQPHFMGMVFTGITHEPFASTLPQFDKYPYDSWEHGFLNTLSFADWSIGEFLKRAQEDGWFDDTIFVFVADHTSGGPADDSLKNHFRIPLVLYAPKLFKGQEARQVVSQLDLPPTLYRLTGLTPAYTAFGRDMFDTSVERAALVSEGINLGLVTKDGEMRHSGGKVLSVRPYTPDFDEPAAEEKLLSLDKAAYTLLKENRWYDPALEEQK